MQPPPAASRPFFSLQEPPPPMLLEDLAGARLAQLGARCRDGAAPCARTHDTSQTLSCEFRLDAQSAAEIRSRRNYLRQQGRNPNVGRPTTGAVASESGKMTMKRIALFVATNIAVLVVISVFVSILGLGRITDANGLNLGALLALSAVIGFTGAIISLLISKPMAKWQTGAHVISEPANADERWLIETVKKLSSRAGIKMPEVAVYEGEPNAFATGAFKNSALVAVSTGLLQTMSREEVEAVLAHEVAHVANGDMVTMTLIQGVVNTFVVFLSRIVGYVVDKQLNKDGNGQGIGFVVTSIVCQIVFGILASMIVAWFSRHREFRADAGAASYMGQPNSMISALASLGRVEPGELPKSIQASGISDKPSLMALFSTHPPIEARIAALEQLRK